MEEIRFDGLGARERFGLLLASAETQAPPARVYTATVPGRDGSLDLSECFGRVFYDDRTAVFTFLVPQGREEAFRTAADLRRLLHGRTVDIARSGLPGVHLRGRVSVGALTACGGWWKIRLTCACGPFYLADALSSSVFYSTGGGGETRTVVNAGDIPVTPDIIVSGTDPWTVNGTDYPVGTSTAHFALDPGENTVTAVTDGLGACEIVYREVRL